MESKFERLSTKVGYATLIITVFFGLFSWISLFATDWGGSCNMQESVFCTLYGNDISGYMSLLAIAGLGFFAALVMGMGMLIVAKLLQHTQIGKYVYYDQPNERFLVKFPLSVLIYLVVFFNWFSLAAIFVLYLVISMFVAAAKTTTLVEELLEDFLYELFKEKEND